MTRQPPIRTSRFTVFTCPRAFQGDVARRQRNAILSWTKLKGCAEVILVGDDNGVEAFARQHELGHCPRVERNEFGTPLIHSIFALAEAQASSQVLAYVNADIILISDFAYALRRVPWTRFLITGRRHDVWVNEEIDFDDAGWASKLSQRVSQEGVLTLGALDYFVYGKGTWEAIPPLAIGRFAWDNWLVYDALHRGIEVIDATNAVRAIHQNHDYSHIAGISVAERDSPEICRNLALAKEGLGYCVSDARWRLSPSQRLRRNHRARYISSGKRVLRRLLRWRRVRLYPEA